MAFNRRPPPHQPESDWRTRGSGPRKPGFLCSPVSMDKDVMKRLFRDAGIPIGKFLTFMSHRPFPPLPKLRRRNYCGGVYRIPGDRMRRTGQWKPGRLHSRRGYPHPV